MVQVKDDVLIPQKRAVSAEASIVKLKKEVANLQVCLSVCLPNCLSVCPSLTD